MAVVSDVAEVEAEAGCEACGAPLSKPGQRFCSMACETRVLHPHANGRHPGTPAYTPEPAEVAVVARLCALDGCGEAVAGKAVYCSSVHQRRAKAQRARGRAAALPQEATNGADAVPALQPSGETPSPPPAVSLNLEMHASPFSFDRLAGVAALLPPGWRLEASSSSVTVTWQA
jgi:hypothetical protein